MPLMTQAAYARRRGVSAVAVHKAIKRGRITLRPDGKIDSDVADREWAENSDPGQVRTPAKQTADGGELGRRTGGTFADFKTAKASYDAKMARLEYEKAAGLLVPAQEVFTKWVEVCVAIRSAVEGLPASCAERVHAARDIREAHSILADECRSILKRLASEVAGMAGGSVLREKSA